MFAVMPCSRLGASITERISMRAKGRNLSHVLLDAYTIAFLACGSFDFHSRPIPRGTDVAMISEPCVEYDCKRHVVKLSH